MPVGDAISARTSCAPVAWQLRATLAARAINDAIDLVVIERGRPRPLRHRWRGVACASGNPAY